MHRRRLPAPVLPASTVLPAYAAIAVDPVVLLGSTATTALHHCTIAARLANPAATAILPDPTTTYLHRLCRACWATLPHHAVVRHPIEEEDGQFYF